MNKKGNIIVMELTKDGYAFPQLSDLTAIKDEVYGVKDHLPSSRGFNSKTGVIIGTFATLALIGSLLVGVIFTPPKKPGTPLDYQIVQLEDLKQDQDLISYYEAAAPSRIEPGATLYTLADIEAVFDEDITKNDLIEIVNEKSCSHN